MSICCFHSSSCPFSLPSIPLIPFPSHSSAYHFILFPFHSSPLSSPSVSSPPISSSFLSSPLSTFLLPILLSPHLLSSPLLYPPLISFLILSPRLLSSPLLSPLFSSFLASSPFLSYPLPSPPLLYSPLSPLLPSLHRGRCSTSHQTLKETKAPSLSWSWEELSVPSALFDDSISNDTLILTPHCLFFLYDEIQPERRATGHIIKMWLKHEEPRSSHSWQCFETSA